MIFIKNKKYNIEFNLNNDSFNNLIQSLNESKKYYHDYLLENNIDVKNFDDEYVKLINILQGELLKYFILINNENFEKYVIFQNDYVDFYKKILKLIILNTNINKRFPIDYKKHEKNQYIMKEIFDHSYFNNINYNFITRNIMNELLYNFYLYNINDKISNQNLYKLDNLFLKTSLFYNKIEEINDNDKKSVTNLENNINEYLNSLSYETIYEREFKKIINSLPNLCLDNLKTIKLDNIINLIDL